MSRRTLRNLSWILGAGASLAAAFAACSPTTGAICGAGTTLKGGVCVPTAPGGSDAGSDAPVLPEDDAGSDAGEEEADDPCPKWLPDNQAPGMYFDPLAKAMQVNCDPACGPVARECGISRCRVAGEAQANDNQPLSGMTGFLPPYEKLTVRLPRDPWKLAGECEPSTASRFTNPQTLAYTGMSPQPRFSFAIDYLFAPPGEPPLAPESPRFAVDPRPYTLRMLNEARLRDTGAGYEWGPGARFNPLPPPGEFGPAERERFVCEVFDTFDMKTLSPLGVEPLGPAAALIVVHTSRPHVPARSLVFDRSPTATCPGAP